MFTPLRAMARDPEGKVLVVGAVATLAVGTVVYSALEGWSLIDSLYVTVASKMKEKALESLRTTAEVIRVHRLKSV